MCRSLERMGEAATIDMFADRRFLEKIPDYRGKLCGSGYNLVSIEPNGLVARCGSGHGAWQSSLKDAQIIAPPGCVVTLRIVLISARNTHHLNSHDCGKRMFLLSVHYLRLPGNLSRPDKLWRECIGGFSFVFSVDMACWSWLSLVQAHHEKLFILWT
ncbi:MAG: hypothetical protein WDM80_09135 [Limisphaerales bacterium]